MSLKTIKDENDEILTLYKRYESTKEDIIKLNQRLAFIAEQIKKHSKFIEADLEEKNEIESFLLEKGEENV